MGDASNAPSFPSFSFCPIVFLVTSDFEENKYCYIQISLNRQIWSFISFFPPFSHSVLKKDEFESIIPFKPLIAHAFCRHCCPLFLLTCVQTSDHFPFWTTTTRTFIFLSLYTKQPSDAVDPNAVWIHISIPKLQNLTEIKAAGSYKPDE